MPGDASQMDFFLPISQHFCHRQTKGQRSFLILMFKLSPVPQHDGAHTLQHMGVPPRTQSPHVPSLCPLLPALKTVVFGLTEQLM